MEYTEIRTTKIKHNLWTAKTDLIAPLKCEISMRGDSESSAKEKLIKFLTEDEG